MIDEARETELITELRPVAFGIAYRMLGEVAGAEDLAQEALLRFHQATERGEEIASPRAFVATIVTRLAIDQLRSARVKRETYVGEWLPEPIVTAGTEAVGGGVADPDADPARRAEIADSLSMAFLVVLERLTPEQRAALLLREVFGYDYAQVAEVIGTSEENARKLASRARSEVTERRPRFEASAEQRDRLAESFFAATQEGDLEGLEAILAHDVELHGDGGGKAPALGHAVIGRVRVARTLQAWWRTAERFGGATVERVEVNGQPGARFLDSEGRLISVISLEISEGQVRAVRSIVNPDKLAHLGPVVNLGELLKPGGEPA